jgi:hypothetical protein
MVDRAGAGAFLFLVAAVDDMRVDSAPSGVCVRAERRCMGLAGRALELQFGCLWGVDDILIYYSCPPGGVEALENPRRLR